MNRVLLLLVVSGFIPSHLRGQTLIQGGPTCEDCVISMDLEYRLVNDTTPAGVVHSVAALPDDVVVFTSVQNATEVLIFQSGDLVGSYGVAGKGPGEFQFIDQILWREPYLYLFDSRLNRVTLLDRHFEWRSSFNLPAAPMEAAVLNNGNVVVNVSIPTAEHAGQLVLLVSESGEPIQFVSDGGVYRLDVPFSRRRHLAPRRDGGFWSAPLNRYELNRWSPEGKLEGRYRRVADWFEAHTQAPRYRPEPGPPPPILAGIQEDAAGAIWTLTRVADPEWEQSFVFDSTNVHGPRYVVENYHRYFDTIIERLDIQELEVEVTARSDYMLEGFAGPGRVFAYSEAGEFGVPVVHVWALQARHIKEEIEDEREEIDTSWAGARASRLWSRGRSDVWRSGGAESAFYGILLWGM